MNLKMRKCLIINDHFLRFMGRIAENPLMQQILACLRRFLNRQSERRG